MRFRFWTSPTVSRLERELAVALSLRARVEAENADWRTRYELLERKHDRLLQQVLAREAQIVHPLHDVKPPKATPLASAMAALGTMVTEFERAPSTTDQAAMSSA